MLAGHLSIRSEDMCHLSLHFDVKSFDLQRDDIMLPHFSRVIRMAGQQSVLRQSLGILRCVRCSLCMAPM